MKIMIFSDIHGNLIALETMLKLERVDGYINLGDVVNYGPWSNECVELILSLENCINVKGNHEQYFLDRECKTTNALVRLFFNHCISEFSKTDVIANYKNIAYIGNFECCHTINNQYIYIDTEISINKNMLIGHSHQQFIRNINGYILLNPGSIGQNRDFINVSNYVIWNIDTNEFELKNFVFDIKLLYNEMKHRKYPKACIEYYMKKIIN